MAKGTRNEGGCRSGIIRCWFWVARGEPSLGGGLDYLMMISASERGLGSSCQASKGQEIFFLRIFQTYRIYTYDSLLKRDGRCLYGIDFG